MTELLDPLRPAVEAYWPWLVLAGALVWTTRTGRRLWEGRQRQRRRLAVRASWQPDGRWTVLYGWYDDRGRLLYLGLSNSPGRRVDQHFWQSAWSRDAREMRILDWFEDRADAHRAERFAIERLRPIHNMHHSVAVAPVRRIRSRRAAEPDSPGRQDAPIAIPVPLPTERAAPEAAPLALDDEPELTRQAKERLFEELLAGFLAAGRVEVRMAELVEAWVERTGQPPSKGRPFLHEQLGQRINQGQVQRDEEFRGVYRLPAKPAAQSAT